MAIGSVREGVKGEQTHFRIKKKQESKDVLYLMI